MNFEAISYFLTLKYGDKITCELLPYYAAIYNDIYLKAVLNRKFEEIYNSNSKNYINTVNLVPEDHKNKQTFIEFEKHLLATENGILYDPEDGNICFLNKNRVVKTPIALQEIKAATKYKDSATFKNSVFENNRHYILFISYGDLDSFLFCLNKESLEIEMQVTNYRKPYFDPETRIASWLLELPNNLEINFTKFEDKPETKTLQIANVRTYMKVKNKIVALVKENKSLYVHTITPFEHKIHRIDNYPFYTTPFLKDFDEEFKVIRGTLFVYNQIFITTCPLKFREPTQVFVDTAKIYELRSLDSNLTLLGLNISDDKKYALVFVKDYPLLSIKYDFFADQAELILNGEIVKEFEINPKIKKINIFKTAKAKELKNHLVISVPNKLNKFYTFVINKNNLKLEKAFESTHIEELVGKENTVIVKTENKNYLIYEKDDKLVFRNFDKVVFLNDKIIALRNQKLIVFSNELKVLYIKEQITDILTKLEIPQDIALTNNLPDILLKIKPSSENILATTSKGTLWLISLNKLQESQEIEIIPKTAFTKKGKIFYTEFYLGSNKYKIVIPVIDYFPVVIENALIIENDNQVYEIPKTLEFVSGGLEFEDVIKAIAVLINFFFFEEEKWTQHLLLDNTK